MTLLSDWTSDWAKELLDELIMILFGVYLIIEIPK